MQPDDTRRPGRGNRHPALRWLLLGLLAVFIVLLSAAAGLWLRGAGPLHDSALRGSIPPDGQRVPAMQQLRSADPGMPSRRSLRGAPILVAASCIDCPSGEIMGGFLARLADRGVPDGTRVVVVGWKGDGNAWRQTSGFPARWKTHVLTDTSDIASAGHLFHVGQNGIVMLYGRDGTWRSTYQLGQLTVDDVRHDLGVLDRET